MGRFAAVVFLCAASHQAWSAEPYQEYKKRIEAAQSLTALKNDLMGDSVSLYNGVTDFSVSDLDVPGMGLPLRLTRHYSVDLTPIGPGEPLSAPKLGGLGNWDIDVPYISGTFDATVGWRGLNSTGSLSDQRCSVVISPEISFSGSISIWDIFQGASIHVPGEGDRSMLLGGTDAPQPADGNPHRWSSRERDSFTCIPMVAGISGEGFSMLTKQGIRYNFNFSVSRYAGSMRQSRGPANPPVTIARTKLYLLATQISDRFGNTLSYSYNGRGNPTSIVATDANGEVRRIDLTYQNEQLVSASTNGRTWSYGYDGAGNLASVGLPDGSAWHYSYAGNLKPGFEFWDGETGPNCSGGPDALAASYELVSTHPSGASARFVFNNLRHYRAGVQKSECVKKISGSDLYYVLRTPMQFDVMSLVSKELSGPGIATPLTWNYSYQRSGQPLWGSSSPAPYPCQTCPTVKNTAVVEPDGTKTIYKYGFLYYFNDGQLLGSENYDAAGNLVSTSTSELMTDAQVAAQPFKDRYGDSIGGDDPGTSRVRPIVSTTVQQDGIAYLTTTNSFDNLARPVSVTKASPWNSRTDVTEYFDDTVQWVLGQPLRVTNSDTGLVVSQTSYNARAQPWQTWSFGKLQQTLTYYGDGSLATVSDGKSQTTTLSNWKRGTPQSIIFADNTSMSATVDDNGWISSVTDENGYTTNYGYDVMGRIASIAYPSGDSVGWNVTTQAFAQVGGVEFGLNPGHWRQIVSTGNARKETYFDALWRPIVTREYDAADVSGTQRFQRLAYDHAGRQIFASYPGTNDALSAGTWTDYDALGRVTSVAQDSETHLLVTTTSYNGEAGYNSITTNPRGYQTRTWYQTFDAPSTERPTVITSPEGAITEISRDVFGKPSAIRRRNADSTLSVTRNYVYDANQRLCKTVEPETGATVTDYDLAGNVDWSASGLALPSTTSCDTQAAYYSGRRGDRIYDARNRLKTLSFPDSNGNQTWSYFNDGKPSQVITSNDAGTSQTVNTYTYNKRRLLTAETTGQVGQFTWSLGYGYDANGALASITYPSGLAVNYAPNALGQPTQAGSYATGVSYFPNGGMKQFTYGNGIVHTMTHNARQLPSQVVDSGGALNNTYSYDELGNVSQILDGLDPSRDRHMQYDGVDRLTQATSASFGGDGVLKYTYDVLDNIRSAKLGGIKEHNYWYDANNRLTNVQSDAGATTIGLSYDLQGNLSAKNGQAFSFDYGNRLRYVLNQESYRYDAQGRRVLSASPSSGKILSMYGQDGVLRRQDNERQGKIYEYVHLNGSLVAKVTTVVAPATPVLTIPTFSGSGSFTASWQAVQTATRYELEESAGGGAWTPVYSGAALSWAASGRQANSYQYRLRACQDNVCSGWGTSASITVSLPPSVAPVLTAPVTAYNGSITIGWTQISGATRYVLEEQGLNGQWQSVYDGALLVINLSSRATGTYSYRVTAWNLGGPGPASSVSQTIMYNVPVGVPALSVPTQSVGGNFTLSWGVVSTAGWYRIEESLDGQSWSLVNDHVAATSYPLSRGANQVYRYRASACNQAGCGVYSTVVSTQVIIRPAVAPVISLPGSSTNGAYTVSWSGVAYAASYQLQERVNGGGWSGISTTASLSVPISGRGDGTYGYRVQACNADGCSPFSAEPSVTVLFPVSGTPSITAPSSVNGLSYTVSWSAVDRATWYNLRSVAPSGNNVVNDVYVLSMGYTQSAPGTWSYQVQGCNASGCGPWSAQISVTLIVNPPPAVPTGLTVTQRTAMDCRVSWMPVVGASYYQLSEMGFVFSWPASFYTFDGICPYPYKIRACNAQGACSAWSSPK